MNLITWIEKEMARLVVKDVTTCDYKEVIEICDHIVELYNYKTMLRLVKEYNVTKPSVVKSTSGVTCMLCGSTDKTASGSCANEDCLVNKRKK